MSDLKKYYNLRFPKNGRYPSYIDIFSIYPYMGEVGSWTGDVNISDVDFIDHLGESGGKVSIAPHLNTEEMSGIPAPKPEDVNLVGATLASTDLPDYNESESKPAGWRSVINRAISNSLTDSEVPENLQLKTLTGSVINVSAGDMVQAFSNTTVYNQTDVTAGSKRCLVYFGAEVSTNYYMNRCFATIVNPYQYSNSDIAARLKSSPTGVSYDINKLPIDAVKTASKTPDKFSSFVLKCDVSVIEVTGEMQLNPRTFVVEAYGNGKSGSGFGNNIELDEGYYIHYDIRLLDEILYEDDKVLNSTGTAKFDMIKDFPVISSYYDYIYTIHMTLRHNKDSKNLAGPLVLTTFVNAPYTSYRMELTDYEGNIVREIETTRLADSTIEIIPTPIYVRVFGSNKFVTDINLVKSSSCISIEAYTDESSSPIGGRSVRLNVINNNAYYIESLSKAFENIVSDWNRVEDLRIRFIDENEMVMSEERYPVTDISPVIEYYITVNTNEIAVYNKSTVYPSNLYIDLKELLLSQNIVSRPSSGHSVSIELFDSEDNRIGNSVIDDIFIDASFKDYALDTVFVNNNSTWNWFKVSYAKITLNGNEVNENNRVIKINFIQQPDSSATITAQIKSDVDYLLVSYNEEGIPTITPDEITFHIKEWIEDIEYPISSNLTLAVELYTSADSEDYYNRVLYNLNESTDTVTISFINTFPTVNWTRVNLVKAIIINSYNGQRHYESTLNIEVHRDNDIFTINQENNLTQDNDNE